MDQRVTELHCIMPLTNVASVMAHGILSYELAARLPHHSVAMQPVQDKRDRKQVPGGLKLHQYANLYFHARNPMLFKRKDEAANLCVLCLSRRVLALDGGNRSPPPAVQAVAFAGIIGRVRLARAAAMREQAYAQGSTPRLRQVSMTLRPAA